MLRVEGRDMRPNLVRRIQDSPLLVVLGGLS